MLKISQKIEHFENPMSACQTTVHSQLCGHHALIKTSGAIFVKCQWPGSSGVSGGGACVRYF
jgi:hypothetical protein